MSHFEDDDPPIKTHAASQEYRDNWDRIFGAEEKSAPTENEPAFVAEARTAAKPWERREQARGAECSTCGAPGTMQCDDAIHETTGTPTRPKDASVCPHCGRTLDEHYEDGSKDGIECTLKLWRPSSFNSWLRDVGLICEGCKVKFFDVHYCEHTHPYTIVL